MFFGVSLAMFIQPLVPNALLTSFWKKETLVNNFLDFEPKIHCFFVFRASQTIRRLLKAKGRILFALWVYFLFYFEKQVKSSEWVSEWVILSCFFQGLGKNVTILFFVNWKKNMNFYKKQWLNEISSEKKKTNTSFVWCSFVHLSHC